MPVSMATGQAAGVCAALAAAGGKDPHEVAASAVQEELIRQGANLRDALKSDSGLLKGLNTYKGALTYAAVGEAQGLGSHDPSSLI